ncbi:DNA repair exonuclease [Fredinandcohnia sp. QZ13]|uniref:metallophosphoesterase family protein n=1 Tax=Fredinandcohnia sp. QZ13 TaxID=3073144 RepID=UPI0028530EF8|nr:DNA repair exonuclease [Fredinandcohnia sp. QZ13]MDR4887214.1 DNA repair exonuclease [Fredinandcohnia sp. QZ13]
MNTITFLHIADLHLDSPFSGLANTPSELFKRVQESTFTSLTRLINIAIEKKVDFVVIAGDLFDGEDRSLRAQSRFRKEMERLQEHHIEVFATHGNHDHLGGNWPHFEWPSNVHVFQNENVEVKPYIKNGETLANIYGFSYTKRAVLENKTSSYEKRENAPFHIGILHGSREGESAHSRYAPFLLSDLQQKGFDYWALGHIHTREILSEDPPIIYPGNIQGRHKKETGEKGGYLVNLSKTGAEYLFFPTSDITWENTTIDISEVASFDQLVDQTFAHIDTLRKEDQGLFLTIEFTGVGPLHDQLQEKGMQEDLVSLLNDDITGKNVVYVVEIKQHTQLEFNREKLRQDSHFIGDLLENMETYEDFNQALLPLRNHQSFRRYIDAFTSEELQEILQDAENVILRELYHSNRR